MCSLSRRSFLGQTLAAGTVIMGASAPGSAIGTAAPKRRFTLDLACGAIGVSADQRKAIRFAQAHRFESVAPSPGELAKLSDSQLTELLAELKEKRLVWGAAGLPVDFRKDDATFRAAIKALPELAGGLRRAGVTRVSTWLRPAHESLTDVANFRQHGSRLREIAKVLANDGLRLGLEYVGPKTSWSASRYPFIHTMAEMKKLIAEIGGDNVGFLLDSWHWYTAHETKDDLLTLTNKDVVACHLNDAPAGIPVDEQVDGRRALPAATGVIDLKAFLGALAQIGYDGPVSAEPFDRELRAMPADAALAATSAAMKKAFALVE